MSVELWDSSPVLEVGVGAPQTCAITSNIHRGALYTKFRSRIAPNAALDRTLVSFQANRRSAFYGWFKYREGFSEPLVTYLLRHLHPRPGMLLDPFAGAGSALFAAKAMAWRPTGMELLPVGVYVMEARQAAERVSIDEFAAAIDTVATKNFIEYFDDSCALIHIPITKGAFALDEERQLIGYLAWVRRQKYSHESAMLLRFAAFCILEDISYTRKDGQYLRWDARSGRSQGKRPFHKGYIPSFREAISLKLRQMLRDIEGFSGQPSLFGEQQVVPPNDTSLDVAQGSCLEQLPRVPSSTIDFVLTSPPYANRYDYTRTYALELVFLGATGDDVKRLRQEMLTCTVENRDKYAQMVQLYAAVGRECDHNFVRSTFEKQAALREVLAILDEYRTSGKLNNDNVVRMVRNYFYEMCFVIFELSRILKPGGVVAMVNDNVRYAGEEVPVDLILSDFAESFGMRVRHIWTVGRGKGNSSQQMGAHGRTALRKCVYVWEKR